jgi:D-sedoheptulose 7-phosphate isomerase
MGEHVREYFRQFEETLNSVSARDQAGLEVDFHRTLAAIARLVLETGAAGKKLLFIGNGGSAAIASHMATDYTKNIGIRALAFNDPSLLTCLGNDFGYARVFEKAVGYYGETGDLLFAISSSGRSENILRGVEQAREMGIGVVTLSGFDETNPLRGAGFLNLYVPAHFYGRVEVIHHALCHAILDTVMRLRPDAS